MLCIDIQICTVFMLAVGGSGRVVSSSRSSPGERATDSSLGTTAVRQQTRVGGYRGVSPPLACIADLGRRSPRPDARGAQTNAVACPGVGYRRGWERVCARLRAETRDVLG